MNISRIFIDRPIMTALVTFAVLLFGFVGYRALPVAALPSVDYPTIQVTAFLPGASPETMASSVATPLERAFATIAGIQSMNSTNSQGGTMITVQFTLERNIDAAAQDIQAAIAKAGGQLPPTMPRPPSYQKVNPAEQPVLYLALTSSTLPLYTVDEYAETLLAQRISMTSGVASVQVFGAQKYAVRIQLNPDALTSRNIGIASTSCAARSTIGSTSLQATAPAPSLCSFSTSGCRATNARSRSPLSLSRFLSSFAAATTWRARTKSTLTPASPAGGWSQRADTAT